VSAIRTWWWAVEEPARPSGVERVLELLAGAGISRVLAASPEHLALAERVAGALDLRAEPGERLVSALAGAPPWPGDDPVGTQLLFVSPASAVLGAISRALGLAARERAPYAPPPGSLTAIDWPPADHAGGRPSLIGIDLDWLPPPPPAERARFPGGPGSAPSIRG
jgi:hypothetical protein